MIAFLLKLLGGSGLGGTAGPWLFLGGVVAIGAAGGVAGYDARGLIDAPKLAGEQTATAQAQKATADQKILVAQCQAIHEKGRADGAEAALNALDTAAASAAAAMDRLAATAAARGISLDALITEINHAPSTRVCSTSAPELAFRRGMQQPAAATSAPAP